MTWVPLTEEATLDEIIISSKNITQVIFKHSTRCPVSDIAKLKLEKKLNENTSCYYLDLITFRSISNKIAEVFSVYHESPQILLIKNETCIYDESHLAIDPEEINEILAKDH